MLARTIIALVSSPWYGLLVSLVIIPLMIVFGVIVVVAASGSIWLAAGFAFLSMLFQAVVYAQCARYAASWTGLQSIVHQPTFVVAVKRCLVVTVAAGFFSGLVTSAFFLVAIHLGGADEWWWMDVNQLVPAIEAAMKSPAYAEQLFSFENLNLASLIFVLKAITLFFVTIIALFAVPRAAGLEPGYARGYTMGLILTRVLIAYPFLAAMSGLLAAGLLGLIELGIGGRIEFVAITAGILYFLEIVFFTGMIFSFEASLLRTAREQAEEENRWQLAGEQVETADFRSIRESWNERS